MGRLEAAEGRRIATASLDRYTAWIQSRQVAGNRVKVQGQGQGAVALLWVMLQSREGVGGRTQDVRNLEEGLFET